MKKLAILALGTTLCLFSSAQLTAQDAPKKEIKVQRHTIMEQFEPDLMATVEERMELKKKRVADMKHKKQILDTLDISERKRQKLLRDLVKSPFSARLNKVMVSIELEDEDEEIKD